MATLKRVLLAVLTGGVGLIVLAERFAAVPWLDRAGAYLISTAVLLAAFALLLGLANVVRIHIAQIREPGSGRGYSILLLTAMAAVLAIGLVPFPGQPLGPSRPPVQWIFENIQVPIQATLGALLVFFVVSAAYRTLRVRTLESAVMLAVALLVLGGQALGGLTPILAEIRGWILEVPVVAGARGIMLGVAIGTALTGLRLLLGVDGGRLE